METLDDDISDFGCRTICFVKTNGDMCAEIDKSKIQKKIINKLVKGKYYKYTYNELDSPIYIGKYLRTNNNRSFFQEDNGNKICISYSKDMLVYFISVDI